MDLGKGCRKLCWLLAMMLPLQMMANKDEDIVVSVNKPGAAIEPTMWGVFFEDINLGADGGIYAELVKNRSFEFNKPFMGWKTVPEKPREGKLLLLNRKSENNNNPRFIRVTSEGETKGKFGIINEGFRGMGIKKDLRYDFSVMYEWRAGDPVLHIGLMDTTGKVLGETTVNNFEHSAGWKRASASFTSNATVLKAKFFVWFEGNGSVDLDMISLFPADTWKGRPGGLRADMVQRLADLKPGFVRFPGGCIVEGYDLSQRYQWKKTVGPVEDRQLLINRWNFEFAHRPAPDYFQTFGLGFFEYFQMAEDIGATALPILNCGLACQFNTAEAVPMDDLDPYIQDALDLVEFANGPVTSTWGKLRSEMGHPAPFNLKMMGVGNENWGPQYIERLKVFTKAIKDKYPDMKLVNSSGTDPNGERFDYLNTELRKMNADIIDEHYYRRPEWFFANAGRYDNYPRNSSKIFGGEYAAQSDKTVSINNRNTWISALSEAAFMTGLERNADVVCMASYAPLFAHVDGWQWTPDLIWVNNLTTIGTPDYYVQQLFSTNRGTRVVPIKLNNESLIGQDSLYASAALDEQTNELIIKVVNAGSKNSSKSFTLDGLKTSGSKATLISLYHDNLDAVNSFEQPENVAPKSSSIDIKKKALQLNMQPHSFSVVRIKL
jgi:alpha-N-arabinofuranosidase